MTWSKRTRMAPSTAASSPRAGLRSTRTGLVGGKGTRVGVGSAVSVGATLGATLGVALPGVSVGEDDLQAVSRPVKSERRMRMEIRYWVLGILVLEAERSGPRENAAPDAGGPA